MAENENEVIEQKKVKPCPISRSDFHASAGEIAIEIHGRKFTASPKDFRPDSDGKASFGWHGHGKESVQFTGPNGELVPVPVQVNILVTCIGSKDAAP